MSFKHYVATEPDWDGGNIKYSIDGGAFAILPASAFTENAYNGTINPVGAGNDNPMQGQHAFTGADGGLISSSWGKSVIDLSALGYFQINIQFRFEIGSDGCKGTMDGI